MKNYMYMLFLSVLMIFVTAIPVLAENLDEVVINFNLVVPDAPPEILPPDIRIEAIYFIDNQKEVTETHSLPIDQMIPKPGWQSDSAREAYNEKKKLLLSQENKI